MPEEKRHMNNDFAVAGALAGPAPGQGGAAAQGVDTAAAGAATLAEMPGTNGAAEAQGVAIEAESFGAQVVAAAAPLPDYSGQGKTYLPAPFAYNFSAAESALLNSGALCHTVTDFSLPGRNGFDLVVARRYNSENAATAYMSTDNYMLVSLLTRARANSHYTMEYGLGFGWQFVLPSMEVLGDLVPYLDGTVLKERYYLHLEDGRSIVVERHGDDDWRLKDSPLQDVTFKREKGGVAHPQRPDLAPQDYDFVVSYKNGSKDYFARESSNGVWTNNTLRFRLSARQDRFGNVIFVHLKRQDEGGNLGFTDSWGRDIVLQKIGGGMVWTLPDGKSVRYETAGGHPDLNTVQQPEGLSGIIHAYTFDPLRLTRVTDQLGRATTYEYYPATGYISTCGFEAGSTNDFSHVLLQKIVHPTGAVTEYAYGNGSAGAALGLTINDNGGVRRYFPLLGRKDVSGGVVYNEIRYAYTLAADGKSIEKTTETRAGDIVDTHNFTDKGLLRTHSTTHAGVQVFSVSYNYGEDAAAENYRLVTKEVCREYGGADASAYWEKTSEYTYSADKKANVVKLLESYADEAENNQETLYEYHVADSLLKSVGHKKDAGTRLVEEYYLDAAGKVVEFAQVLENGVLKEKTQYAYGSTSNDRYCLVRESRFYTEDGSALVSMGTAVETRYTYDSAKFTHAPVKKEVRGVGGSFSESLDYDAMGRVVRVTDGLGQVTKTQYDALGRVVLVTHPDGTSTGTKYDDTANWIEQTDEAGNRQRVEYTPLGQVRAVYLMGALGAPNALLETTAYDNLLRPVTVCSFDGLGNTAGNLRMTTSMSYDRFDRVLAKSVTGTGIDMREEHSYDAVYRDASTGKKVRLQKKNVLGDSAAPTVESSSYSSYQGWPLKEFVGGARTVSCAYDILGNKVSQTDALGHVTRFGVDYAGRVVSTTRTVSGQQQVSRVQYDALGRKVFSVDFLGNASSFRYDARGLLLESVTPFDARTAKTLCEYDLAGRLVWKRVDLGGGQLRETRYVYDARGRQTEVYAYLDAGRASWLCTRMKYDAVGNKLEVRSGVGSAGDAGLLVKYSYDRFGNVLSMTDALGQVERCSYDVLGRLVSRTDRNGGVSTFSYDVLGRLVKQSVVAAGKTGNISNTQSTVYTKNGAKRSGTSTQSSPSATEPGAGQSQTLAMTYQYNNKGQVVSQTEPDGIEKRFAYDARGSRSSFTVLRNGQVAIQLAYEYDEVGRLARVRQGSASGVVLAEYAYDANGSCVQKSYPQTGMETRVSYNKVGLPVGLVNSRAGVVLSEFTHSYNLDGSMATKVQDGVTTSYTYDKLGRLTEEYEPGWQRIAYVYDTNGNRKEMRVSENAFGPYTVAYTYDQNNRLLEETKTEAHATELTRYAYDKNGNQLYSEWSRTGKPDRSIPEKAREIGKIGFLTEVTSPGMVTIDMRRYNGLGQLIWMSRDAVEASYSYRPDGLRHSKTTGRIYVPKTKHQTSLYYWDGQDLVGEVGFVGPVAANGNAGAGAQVKARYLRANGKFVAQQIDNTLWYYLHNVHGDVVQRVGSNGVVATEYKYDAFGNDKRLANAGTQATDGIDTDPNPFRYCGEYWDSDLGEYYLRARTYNPRNGRFSSGDPARSGENWYAYCANNPVTRKDPSGLSWISDAIKNVGKAVAGVASSAKNALNKPVQNAGRTIVNTVAQVQQQARTNAMAEAGVAVQQTANDARMAVVGQMRAEAMNMQYTLENLRNISEIDMLRSKAMNRQQADFIYGQASNSYFAGLPIGDLGNGAANGCGVVAAYNVMELMGKNESIDSVLSGVGGARMLGLWGVAGFGITNYLNRSGFTANGSIITMDGMFDELIKSHDAVILEYFSGESVGGHYVAIEYVEGQGYLVYNEYTRDETERIHPSIDAWLATKGHKPFWYATVDP